MITDTDITKIKRALKEDFATKEDLKAFATKEDLADVRVELGEMHDTIDTMASAIGRIENVLDKFTGAIHDQQIENAAGTVHLLRHDRQIEALAVATNVTLPD